MASVSPWVASPVGGRIEATDHLHRAVHEHVARVSIGDGEERAQHRREQAGGAHHGDRPGSRPPEVAVALRRPASRPSSRCRRCPRRSDPHHRWRRAPPPSSGLARGFRCDGRYAKCRGRTRSRLSRSTSSAPSVGSTRQPMPEQLSVLYWSCQPTRPPRCSSSTAMNAHTGSIRRPANAASAAAHCRQSRCPVMERCSPSRSTITRTTRRSRHPM